ncbi:MAG: hypothetical protein KBD27_02865 [Candidatus Moranbacteria bacterium]|nr:hypothetical protein [Candidatus Moranbacteria bacterium]
MNKFRVSSVPLALAVLSATISTSTRSRAGFDDISGAGKKVMYIGDGISEGGGNKAVDTSVAGTSASIIEQARQPTPGIQLESGASSF